MLFIRAPWDYGVTADDIAQAHRSGNYPVTALGWFDAAKDAVLDKVCAEFSTALRDRLDEYKMIYGPQPYIGDVEKWCTEGFEFGHYEDLLPADDALIAWKTYFPSVENFCLYVRAHGSQYLDNAFGYEPTKFLDKFSISPFLEDVIEGQDADAESDPAHAEETPPVPLKDRVPPPIVSKADLAEAWESLGGAVDVDWRNLGANLGLSGQTARNYATGRTQPKCSIDQAAQLSDFCFAKIAALTRAKAIFDRLKG